MNSRIPSPRRVCRKRIGPGPSRRIRHATNAKIGAVRSRPTLAPARSIARLSAREAGNRRGGRQREQGQPLDAVQPGVRADRVEQPRHDVHLDAGVLEHAEDPHPLVVGLAREGDDDALDVEPAHELLELGRLPEHRGAREVGADLPRVGVDEAEQVDPVLAMLHQLARDELADVARAEDQRVLQVEQAPAAGRPGDGPRGGDQHDRERPEGGELVDVRVGHPRHHRADEDDERPDGHEQEDADEVVDRRVLGAQVVVVVEAEELREDDPGGQRAEEQQPLDERVDPTHLATGAEDELDHEHGDGEAEDVGQDEHAPDERAAPVRAPLAGAAQLEQESRPLVEPLRPVVARPGVTGGAGAAHGLPVHSHLVAGAAGSRRIRSGRIQRRSGVRAG
ncbi:MAG: hypothetical protein R3C15_00815 [Thermoleophilia bacterium]